MYDTYFCFVALCSFVWFFLPRSLSRTSPQDWREFRAGAINICFNSVAIAFLSILSTANLVCFGDRADEEKFFSHIALLNCKFNIVTKLIVSRMISARNANVPRTSLHKRIVWFLNDTLPEETRTWRRDNGRITGAPRIPPPSFSAHRCACTRHKGVLFRGEK